MQITGVRPVDNWELSPVSTALSTSRPPGNSRKYKAFSRLSPGGGAAFPHPGEKSTCLQNSAPAGKSLGACGLKRKRRGLWPRRFSVKKPRRVRRPQAANEVRSFSSAACTSEKIPSRPQVCKLSANSGQCVRAAGCNPLVGKARRGFSTVSSAGAYGPGAPLSDYRYLAFRAKTRCSRPSSVRRPSSRSSPSGPSSQLMWISWPSRASER